MEKSKEVCSVVMMYRFYEKHKAGRNGLVTFFLSMNHNFSSEIPNFSVV